VKKMIARSRRASIFAKLLLVGSMVVQGAMAGNPSTVSPSSSTVNPPSPAVWKYPATDEPAASEGRKMLAGTIRFLAKVIFMIDHGVSVMLGKDLDLFM